MSMSPEQRRAVQAEGKNVLVSASAGSGKTFVMIQRVIRLIVEGKADVGDILAVTFVKLAAQEMKEKLTKALSEEIAKGGKNAQALKRQIAEVPTADFCTLHSFCANFIRKYFFEAGLDPKFQVMDESEANVLKQQSLDVLFERLLEENDVYALHLAEVFARRRRLSEAKDVVRKTYEFLWAEEDPVAFAERALSYYTPEAYDDVRTRLWQADRAWAQELQTAARKLAEDSAAMGITKYAEKAAVCADMLSPIVGATTVEDYLARLGEWSFRMPGVRFSEQQAATGKRYQARFKAITEGISDLRKSALPLAEDRETGVRALMESRKTCEALISVTLRFHEVYSQNKKDVGKLDFSDLEHYTLRLLENEDVRAEARARYKYVFADEYQDINGAQESILRRLSKDNLFMVGDVKQSIYAFRGCNPEYFTRKFSRFRTGEGEAILLNGNYRCCDAVLDTVNRTFSRVMTEQTSGVDYATDGAMTGGGLYEDNYGRTQLHVVAEQKKKTETETKVYRVKDAPLLEIEQREEEKEIVRIVREELERTWYDTSEKAMRPVRYGDIAVLARTGTVVERVATALAAAGIPVSAERKQSIVGFPEIRTLIDLLRLICCAEQDGALVSVLLSPIGGLDEEELAKIRLSSPSGAFRDAVCAAREREDEIGQKLRDFYAYFATVRRRADFLGAGELLEKVIAEKAVDVYYAAREGGDAALRRIHRFLAESRTASGELTTAEFLDKACNMPSSFVLSEAGGEDGVRVLSMHASKGLEFPVVILAHLSGKINDNDLHQDVLPSREYGLAVRCFDLARRKKSETLLRTYVGRDLKKALAREEMRLLYVAMTRAKYSLHLVCSSLGGELGTHGLLSATKMSDFLAETDAPLAAQAAGETPELPPPTHVLAGQPDEALTREIARHLRFVYPHAAAVNLPAKTTVTRVSSHGEEYYATTHVYGESSAEKGTAIHALLEAAAASGKLGEAQTCSAAHVRALAQQWVAAGALAQEHFDLVDFDEAARVLRLPVFGQLRGAALYPEQPFMALFAASELPPLGASSDERVLVQGVIDLLAVKDGKAWVLDYKRTTLKRKEDVLDRYRTQLTLYRTAVERALGLPVERLSILNLLSGEEIAVE